MQLNVKSCVFIVWHTFKILSFQNASFQKNKSYLNCNSTRSECLKQAFLVHDNESVYRQNIACHNSQGEAIMNIISYSFHKQPTWVEHNSLNAHHAKTSAEKLPQNSSATLSGVRRVELYKPDALLGWVYLGWTHKQ